MKYHEVSVTSDMYFIKVKNILTLQDNKACNERERVV